MVTVSSIREEQLPALPMKIRAQSSAQALAQVRSELGDDAIILSTRSIVDPETNRRMVEIEATLGEAPTVDLPVARAKASLFRMPSPANNDGNELNSTLMTLFQELRTLRGDVSDQRQHNESMIGELRGLRRELREVEHVVSNLTSEHRLMREYSIPAEWVPAFRRLIGALIDPAIADEILKETIELKRDAMRDPEKLGEALVEGVARRIKTKPILGQAVPPPVVSIVGPAGAGKTSMVAKIAAHAVLRGHVSVGILTHESAGSMDTLSRVASALGVPITTCEAGSGAMSRLVNKMQNDGIELIIVDTPAMTLNDREANLGLWRELNTVPENEIVAVVPANWREIDLSRTSRELAKLGFDRFAFTHMDETLRTGGLLSAISQTGRPIGALSAGRRVPDDLVVPDAKALALAMVRPPRIELGRAEVGGKS